jgi:hypothetical protein
VPLRQAADGNGRFIRSRSKRSVHGRMVFMFRPRCPLVSLTGCPQQGSASKGASIYYQAESILHSGNRTTNRPPSCSL